MNCPLLCFCLSDENKYRNSTEYEWKQNKSNCLHVCFLSPFLFFGSLYFNAVAPAPRSIVIYAESTHVGSTNEVTKHDSRCMVTHLPWPLVLWTLKDQLGLKCKTSWKSKTIKKANIWKTTARGVDVGEREVIFCTLFENERARAGIEPTAAAPS